MAATRRTVATDVAEARRRFAPRGPYSKAQQADDCEAALALQSGLTPRLLEQATRSHSRRTLAVEHGVGNDVIYRLGKRWGIERG